MSDFIPAIITVILCSVLSAVGFGFLPCVAEKKQLYYKNSIIFSAAAVVTALVLALLIPAVTHTESVPSPLSVVPATVGSFCGIVLARHLPEGMVKTFLKRLGKAVIIIFVAETFLFNFNRFISKEHTITQIPIANAIITEGDAASLTGDSVTFEKDSTIIYELNTDEDIGTIALGFNGMDKWVKATISITDDNFSNTPIPVGSKFFSGTYDRPLYFPLHPYGKLRSIYIALSDVNSPVTLNMIKLDDVMPYYFSDIRFLVVLLIAAIILAVVTFRFYKWEYSSKKLGHRIAMLCTAAACSASMLIFLVPEAPDNPPIEYKEGMDIRYSDPYVQMFDALQKGQVTLDVEPSDSLKALENPYDSSVRSRDSVDFMWDRAYYNGKYYSYYTIVPVLLFHYPYYFISGGNLPNMNKTTVFFGMIGVLFMTGAILAFVKRFNKRPNFLLLILSVIASTTAGGFYLGTFYSSQYSLPSVVSSAFLMLCLWCGVSAFNMIKSKLSYLLFAISGLSFALCVASRAPKAISALILAPLFIAILVGKNHTVKTKVTSAVSFLVPVVIGMTALMAYNYVRFDSLLEFGQSYQLTVSNVQANITDISYLPNSFVHYFIHPLTLSGDFPYLSMSYTVFCNNGKYMYEAFCFGVFNFPMILLGTLAMPFFVWHTRRRKSAPYRYNKNRIRNYTYVLMFVLMVVTAFMDYCVGGAIDGYIIDILPVMMLMSILVLIDIQSRMKKFPVLEGKTVCAVSIAASLTIVISFMMLLTIRDYRKLLEHFPNLFSELERLICFWH